MVEVLQRQDKTSVATAIDLTRRMRMAAISVPDMQSTDNEYNLQVQEVLRDAEELASITSRLIVAAVSNLSQQEQRDQLESTNATFWLKYSNYEPYAHVRIIDTNTEVLGMAALALSMDWMGAISVYFAEINKISLPEEEIISSNTGIISPLSTDYHLAMVNHEFIRLNVSENTFGLKPAIFDPIRDRIALTYDANGQLSLNDKANIAVFVDTVHSGTTANAVTRAVEESYKAQAIYSPVK